MSRPLYAHLSLLNYSTSTWRFFCFEFSISSCPIVHPLWLAIDSNYTAKCWGLSQRTTMFPN